MHIFVSIFIDVWLQRVGLYLNTKRGVRTAILILKTNLQPNISQCVVLFVFHLIPYTLQFKPFGLLAAKDFWIIWLSNLLIKNILDMLFQRRMFNIYVFFYFQDIIVMSILYVKFLLIIILIRWLLFP